jgi:hypothetical protein
MERMSPKIEIINYFDNLINSIDIDIESSLEKCYISHYLKSMTHLYFLLFSIYLYMCFSLTFFLVVFFILINDSTSENLLF